MIRVGEDGPRCAGSRRSESALTAQEESEGRQRLVHRERLHGVDPLSERKELNMSNSSIEFHKIWIEQCAAAEDIREQFGSDDAIRYLIGEKLFSFVQASEDDQDFAAELPAFVTRIRQIFSSREIREFLDEVERTQVLAPVDEPDADLDEFENDEDALWPAHPVAAAEGLLRFARVRTLLQD